MTRKIIKECGCGNECNCTECNESCGCECHSSDVEGTPTYMTMDVLKALAGVSDPYDLVNMERPAPIVQQPVAQSQTTEPFYWDGSDFENYYNTLDNDNSEHERVTGTEINTDPFGTELTFDQDGSLEIDECDEDYAENGPWSPFANPEVDKHQFRESELYPEGNHEQEPCVNDRKKNYWAKGGAERPERVTSARYGANPLTLDEDDNMQYSPEQKIVSAIVSGFNENPSSDAQTTLDELGIVGFSDKTDYILIKLNDGSRYRIDVRKI